MRLSRKQREELAAVAHFVPADRGFDAWTDEDVARFFAWSDRGVGAAEIKAEAMSSTSGLAALYWGKQRRDLQVAAYREDWGVTCFPDDFVEQPGPVVAWLARVLREPSICDAWRAAHGVG